MQKVDHEHKKAFIGTVIFHIILILIVVFMGFTTPLPLPGEEGILVNFGDSETGIGEREPSNDAETKVESPAQEQQSAEAEQGEEEIITQNFEEAPTVEEKSEEVSGKDNNKTEQEENIKDKKEEKEEKEEKDREVDPRSIFPGSGNSDENGENQGIEGGEGNQGEENGIPGVDNYDGDAGGGGISYSLNGRIPQKLPKPKYICQRSGIVVVEITVDKEGRVVNANPGVKGSTSLDDCLLTEAKKAALSARFDRKPDAPALQKGKITYHFKLH